MSASAPTTRIGPARGRRPESHLVVALLVGAFIVVALLKPWQGAERGAVPELRAEPAAARPAAAAGQGEPVRIPLGVPRLSWNSVRSIVQPRDGWGIRTIVARPDRGQNDRPIGSNEIAVNGWFVSERWAPFTLSVRGPDVFEPNEKTSLTAALTLDSGRGAIAALGVTAPFASTPLDTRAYGYTAGALPERLALRDLGGAVPSVERLYLPPRGSASRSDHWAPGVYGIQLLLGWRTAAVTVSIPGPAVSSAEPSAPRSGAMRGTDRRDTVSSGAFAIDFAGVARAVVTRSSWARSESAAWLARPVAVSDVARGPVPLLGFALRPGLRLLRARLTPLIPQVQRLTVTGTLRLAPASGGPGAAYGRVRPWIAYFEPPLGNEWPAGSYRIEARWSDGGAERSGAWQIELPPAREPPFAPFLAAARAAKPYASRRSVIAGPINSATDPRGRVVRVPNVHELPAAGRAMPGAESCRGVARVQPEERVLAIGHDHGVVPSVTVNVVGRFGFRGRVPVAEATDAIEGLVLFAPLGGANWVPGRYDVTLTFPEPVYDPDPVERISFCVLPHVEAHPSATRAQSPIVPSGALLDR